MALVDGADSLTGVEFFRFSDGLFEIGPAGTLVPAVDPGGVPPDNYPGSLVLTGVGSEGQTLTSAVTDLDGIASPVDFQWSISLDEGATWAPIPGASMAEYVVGVADIGYQLRLSATYTDAKGVTEALTSAAKAIQPANDGDFSVLLIQLAAPAGASVMTPLTTLVQGAISLGLSPNMASASVKSVLGLEPSLNLQSYDAWTVLQSDPSDPQALALEKVAVQVAILASLWGDQSGLGISQAVVAVALAAPAALLDLSSAADIASIMGLAIDDPLVVEIADRNWNIFEATSVAQIEAVWLDILSVQDQIVSTTIGDLTAHINQAPQGIASALLPVTTEDIACSVSASDLLIGLSDPDAGTLSIGSLVTDLGSVNTVDGLVFTLTAPANYNGPIELTYQVLDGQGGSTLATQLIVIAPVNDLPTGVVQIVGVAEVGKVLSVTQTLADADGIGPLHYSWTADGVAISGAADASSFTLTQDQAGKTVAVGISYTDLQGSFETVFSAATDPVEGVGVTLNGTRRSDFLEGTQWDDVLNGLAGNDVLAGAAGSDTLNGGAGADILRGGADDDLYFVDNRSDQTLETMLAPATGDAGGVDTVKAEISWTLGLYIENLTLIGTRGIDGRGNALDNVVLGNAAGNALKGMGGNDVLAGGAGNDSLNGSVGADRYVFDSAPDARRNRDSIIDFTATDDSIVLDSTVFKAFGSPGPIAAENFGIGTSALSEQQFLVYDNQRGTLAYDADGNGAGFAIPFVVLMGAPTIDATDFLVF